MKTLAAALIAAAALGSSRADLSSVALAKGDDKELTALLKQSGYPLAEALQKALDAAKSGVVVSAELEEEDGKAVFSVDVAQGKKTVEIVLDAKTGELVEKAIEDDDQSELVKACKVTLGQAIQTALQKVPGQVVAAEAEIEDDKPILEVKIFGDGKVQKVKIDAVTGEVLKVKARKLEVEKKEERQEGDKK